MDPKYLPNHSAVKFRDLSFLNTLLWRALWQFYSISYDLYAHVSKVYYLPLGSSLHSSVKRIFPLHLIQHHLIKSAILPLLESALAHSSLSHNFHRLQTLESSFDVCNEEVND